MLVPGSLFIGVAVLEYDTPQNGPHIKQSKKKRYSRTTAEKYQRPGTRVPCFAVPGTRVPCFAAAAVRTLLDIAVQLFHVLLYSSCRRESKTSGMAKSSVRALSTCEVVYNLCCRLL